MDAAIWPPAPGHNEPRPACWPPAGWPTRAQLDYTRTLIVVVLLLLALPWLVGKLVTQPAAVLSGMGQGLARKPPT